jgi:hypothetical protein
MNAQVVSYAIEYASLRARLLSATGGFPPSDIDDARQNLLLDCLRRWPKFDCGRGDSAGFIRGVMRNHTTVLIARRSRRVCHEIFADDSAPDSESPNGVPDLVRCDDRTIAFNVSLDVRRVLRRLPRHLQSLAEHLCDLSVSEVCVITGKSRSRIYQMILEIRAAFTEAGLGPIRGAPSTPGKCHRRPTVPHRKVNS